MKERKASGTKQFFPKENGLIFVEKDEDVLAFCQTCDGLIFVGNSRNRIDRRILIESVTDHLESFGVVHHIDIIYPKAAKDRRFVDGADLVSPSITGFISDYRNQ